MGHPFDHFGGFLFAVWGHAFTLLAGCAITVVIGWIERHILKKQMPFWADLSILLAFLFFACFQAWHDEYGKAVDLQAKLDAKPTIPIQVNMSPIVVPPAQVLIQSPSNSNSRPAGLEVPAIQRMTDAQLNVKVKEFTQRLRAAVMDFQAVVRKVEDQNQLTLRAIPKDQSEKV